jgi:hypothetical protein
MKLLVHLVSADIRRFRLMIAVWIATVVADTLTTAVGPVVAGQPGPALAVAAALIWLARMLLFVALVATVVQSHPLVGSDAFWMTRPIPARTLLLSKLVLLTGLLVLVPLVCDAVLMAIYRVPRGEVALVLLQSSLLRILMLVMLMVVASFTPNLARFAVLCGSVLLALAVLSAVAVAIAISEVRDESFVAVEFMATGSSALPVPGVADPTPALVAILAFIAAGLLVLIVQYRGRSLRRSVPLGVAALFVAWLVPSAWERWLSQEPPMRAPGWADSASTIRLGADTETISVEADAAWSGRPRIWRIVRAAVWFTEVPGDWHATARLAGATLDLSTGVRLMSPGYAYPATLPVEKKYAEPPLHRVLRNVLGVQRIGGSLYPARGEASVVFLIREEDRQRSESATATYRGHFQVDLTNVAIAARLPLARGATFQEGAYRVKVDELEQSGSGMTVRARISNVSTIFDRRPRPVYSIYLRNPRLREAASGAVRPFQENVLMPQMMFAGFSGINMSSALPGFAAGANLIRFPGTHGYPEEQMGLDTAWLAGAEIVIIRMTAEGAMMRTLEMSGVSLSNDPAKLREVVDRAK